MELILKEIRDEISDIKTVIWETSEEFTWNPGQFLEYELPQNDPDSRGTKRWFTISSAPFEGYIAQTTRFVEKPSSFKNKLLSMKPGDRIDATGPKGKFVIEDYSRYHVFIAGGIGITPFRSMIAQSTHDKKYHKGLLLYQNRDNNFVFKNELEQYSKVNDEFVIKYSTSQLTLEDILGSINTGPIPVFYLSGPEPFVEHYIKILADAGFLDEQIKKDFFPGYEWKFK